MTIDRKIDGHKVVSIGKSAFKDCTTLESVLLWADVESIEDYAFAGCKNLESVIVWGDDTIIEKDAFANCPKLKDRPIQE